ncbi:MAG: MFS transporter [Bacillota bacterium]|nr:MFS transporter [Bacillota bacterium]
MSTTARAANPSQVGGWQRYRRVLRHRNFALLWMGQTVSWFGDSLYFVSLLWLVQELTGSRALMGVVAACRTIPALFGLFAGVLVDRMDRRRIMMVADTVRACIVLSVPLLMAAGLLETWHIPVVAFLLAAAGVPFNPSQQAVLPGIVEREDLAQANSLLTISQQFANVIGYAVAGLLIAAIGVGPMFSIDAITFLVSVAAIWAMRLAPAVSNPALAQATSGGQQGGPAGRRPGGRQWWGQLQEGLHFIKSQRAMMTVIPLVMLLNFLVAPFAVLLPAWVSDILRAGPGVFGLLQTAITAGMIAGSLVVGLAAARARRSTLALGALGGFGLGALLFSLSRTVALTVAIMAAMGCANTVANIMFVTWAQTIVPKQMMGRVFGALGTMSQAVSPLGQTLAGFAGQVLALPLIYGGVGTVLVAVAAVYAAVPVLRGAFNMIESDLSPVTQAAARQQVAATRE